MPAAFGVFSLILAASGVAIGAAGVKDAAEGQAIGGAIGIAISMVVFYGAYLLARTSRRTRSAVASDNSARVRQARDLRYFAWYVLVGLAIVIVLPVSGLLKVIIMVMLVGGTVVAMAARADPPRRGRK